MNTEKRSASVSDTPQGIVRMWEGTLVLPTYETSPPDRLPLFYRHEEVQLAEKRVYPYPFYDVQSAEKKDVTYRAVFLENEYLKICVTPQMGGRLYYALDKTNGYELVYNNRVVKPALIGTLGAWTSGGVEWNTPHHHRATSLLEVDCVLEEGSDGSKTLWVGEYEKRSQTRWLVGLTLEPGKAYVRMDFKSMDVTPFQVPALFFANAAVHVNDRYQFCFPPDVEMVNFHYVTEFARWPILNQVYQSTDYTAGEDLSWWNAARQPVSFFVTRTHQDFMGGIDHERKAGTALVGDHRIFKGKKIWNWGKNEVQASWDQKLTDEDGPYAELMMGFYSDNQPDYNFVAPFETKVGSMFLYGLKGLDGLKEANRDLALNLDLEGQEARIQVNATAILSGVKLCLTCKDALIFEEAIDLSPTTPCLRSVRVGEGILLKDLRVAVLSRGGDTLIAWQKPPVLNEPFPEVYQDPLDPRDYQSSQDLFFAGLKLEQFGNTNFDCMKYYEAALRLNPMDVMSHTQVGLVHLKRGEYGSSEEHLRKAVDLVTGNHKKAEDATSLYYLGVCLMKQGRIDEALDMLYRSTWAYEWTSAGYTLVAQLEGSRKNWVRALEAAERAYGANTLNVEAVQIRAMVLRQMGALDDALRAAQQALKIDPLSFVALNEICLLSARISVGLSPGECRTRLLEGLRQDPYNFIETATRYAGLGLYGEAADVMSLAAGSGHPSLNAHPMVLYHLGFYWMRAGIQTEANEVLDRASRLSTDHCFPYGDESVKVLRFATERNPEDATAAYLLGNALADSQPGEAIRHWTLASQKDPKKAIIHRNIAYLQANSFRNTTAALEHIMRAIALDPSEPRYFSEAHLYMSYASFTPQQVSDFLHQYGAIGRQMTEMQLMEIKLSLFYADYDRAIRLLKDMQYHIKEGATFNPHVYWFDAYLQAGIAHMKRKDHGEAEKAFLAAMEFPANLEAERDGKIGIAHYYLGLNCKQAGNLEEAASQFQRMVDYTYSQGWGAGDFPELSYYKAMASLELGQDRAEAEKRLRDLIADGEKRLVSVKDSRHITVSVEEAHSARTFLLERELSRKQLKVSSYFLQGLGYWGLGDKDKARAFFSQALETDPISVDARLMLDAIQD